LKLVRFAVDNRESYGVLINEKQTLDLPILSQISRHPTPTTLNDLIIHNKRSLKNIEHIIHKASQADKKKATINITDTRLLTPIHNPPKIVCLGLNYRDHIKEQNAALPKDLIIFMKPRTAIIGLGDAIIKPSFVTELDYEAELAIIIGQRGKNLSLGEAKQHIFGYTCFNDVSARDIQFKDKQWTRGKGFDTFAPIGPCITTSSQVENPQNLWIKTRVNGELRQNSSTCNMVFSVYDIVHKLSQVMTLEPCDIIATGTPAGVGFAMKPKPKFLKPGDTVEVEIENIGILRNNVAETG
jgi:2-keto-4-pentenoate hydratase/2-oxohepta-3-ene-1,7-dioic acid hydratase in catechol pathway